MLQLIGWLGCLYLVVKGLELSSRKDEDVNQFPRNAGIILAWGGAFVFSILLHQQGNQTASPPPYEFGLNAEADKLANDSMAPPEREEFENLSPIAE